MRELIIALIMSIASEMGVPPEFAVAITLTENEALDQYAINRNRNGTYDRGLMQLNTSWFTDENWACLETNIRAGVKHIKWLMEVHRGDTWWSVAVSYNAGTRWFRHGIDPPASSTRYADAVMRRWREIYPYAPVVVAGR